MTIPRSKINIRTFVKEFLYCVYFLNRVLILANPGVVSDRGRGKVYVITTVKITVPSRRRCQEGLR